VTGEQTIAAVARSGRESVSRNSVSHREALRVSDAAFSCNELQKFISRWKLELWLNM
jgi:hypothetical protein